MFPTLLAGMALQAGTSIFSAGMQSRSAARQGRLAIWQAVQEGQQLYDEAGRVSRAQVDEYTDNTRFTLDQAIRGTRVYQLSQEISRKNAERALASANVNENRQREETARALAGQTAYFSANNLDPTYGSPLMLQGFGAAQGEADAMIIRAGGAQEAAEQNWNALGFAMQTDDALAGAGWTIESGAKATGRNVDSAFASARTRGTSASIQAGITASNARAAGVFGAATTLLNTASNWAGMAMGGKLSAIGIKGA